MDFLKKEVKEEKNENVPVNDAIEFVAEDINNLCVSNEAVSKNEKKEEIEPLNPLKCFFENGDNTEKWLVKLAKGWHFVISIIWFFIGSLTFAPILYLSHKTNPIFKNKKKSLLCGIAIYSLIVILITVLILT